MRHSDSEILVNWFIILLSQNCTEQSSTGGGVSSYTDSYHPGYILHCTTEVLMDVTPWIQHTFLPSGTQNTGLALNYTICDIKYSLFIVWLIVICYYNVFMSQRFWSRRLYEQYRHEYLFV